MTLNELTVRLLFLFLPGIVCSLIVAQLTTHRDLRPADHIIPSFIYGFLVYVIYSAVAAGWDTLNWAGQLPRYELVPADVSPARGIAPVSILVSICIAPVLAFALSAVKNHKLVNRTARAMRVTKKFGDRDVWSFLMNSESTDWVVVRDPEHGLYYLGQITAYSDEESTREILLRNTRVFDNVTGEQRYLAGDVYFSFAREGAILEIPDEGES